MAIDWYFLKSVTGNADGYTLVYSIKTDDPLDGPLTIYNDPKFPFRAGDIYEMGNDIDPDVVAEVPEITDVSNDRTSWEATIEFTASAGDNGGDDPLSAKPKFEWLFSQSERPIEQDIYGQAIRNAAGDRFDDIITVEDSQPILQITRNEPAANLRFGWDIRDTVNRDPWYGFPRRSVKFQPPRAASAYHKTIGLYYEKSYAFKFARDTWAKIVLNQGLQELKAGEKKPIQVDGKDVIVPELLDASGEHLDPAASPVWLDFHGYPESTFPLF